MYYLPNTRRRCLKPAVNSENKSTFLPSRRARRALKQITRPEVIQIKGSNRPRQIAATIKRSKTLHRFFLSFNVDEINLALCPARETFSFDSLKLQDSPRCMITLGNAVSKDLLSREKGVGYSTESRVCSFFAFSFRPFSRAKFVKWNAIACFLALYLSATFSGTIKSRKKKHRDLCKLKRIEARVTCLSLLDRLHSKFYSLRAEWPVSEDTVRYKRGN